MPVERLLLSSIDIGDRRLIRAHSHLPTGIWCGFACCVQPELLLLEAQLESRGRRSGMSPVIQRVSTSFLNQSLLGGQSDQNPSKANDPLTLICSACRTGPFSYEGFRQAVAESHYDATTGYCYTTTWAAISQSSSSEACSWCTIVRRTRDGLTSERFPPGGQEAVEIRVQVATGFQKGIYIYLDGYKAVDYTIYAEPGACFFFENILHVF